MNLTINEQLMHDTKDANLCIFIANLASWLKTNSAKLHQPLEERNFREGRYWSYNSIQGFVKFFGFWSTQNIKTIIKKGIAEGLIVTNTFNRKKFDNTLWYSLTDKGLKYYPFLLDTTLNTIVRSNKPLVNSNHTIPVTTTTSNNTITTSEFHNSQSSSSIVDEKSDLLSNCSNDSLNVTEVIDVSNLITRSDYRNNHVVNKALLSKSGLVLQGSECNKNRKEKSNGLEKGMALECMWEMIGVYREIFPNNPQPHSRVIATSLQKTLQALIKRWPEADPEGKPFNIASFRRYLEYLRSSAPQFSLGEWENANGKRKKNNLETFARWNTFVKCLEEAYS
jgi:hypothetical protein